MTTIPSSIATAGQLSTNMRPARMVPTCNLGPDWFRTHVWDVSFGGATTRIALGSLTARMAPGASLQAGWDGTNDTIQVTGTVIATEVPRLKVYVVENLPTTLSRLSTNCLLECSKGGYPYGTPKLWKREIRTGNAPVEKHFESTAVRFIDDFGKNKLFYIYWVVRAGDIGSVTLTQQPGTQSFVLEASGQHSPGGPLSVGFFVHDVSHIFGTIFVNGGGLSVDQITGQESPDNIHSSEILSGCD